MIPFMAWLLIMPANMAMVGIRFLSRVIAFWWSFRLPINIDQALMIDTDVLRLAFIGQREFA